MNRNAKIYIDYQQLAQLPLNVRGNAETSIFVQESKYKYPFLLGLFRTPFDIIQELTSKVIRAYESYEPYLTKDTRRRGKSVRKRNDYTFTYSILRYLNYYIDKYLISWFDKFTYLVLYAEERDLENNPIRKLKYKINSQDETYHGSRLYNSTFLSRGYESKASKSIKRWPELRSYSSLNPSDEELKLVNSNYINKQFFDSDVETKPAANDCNVAKKEEIKALDFD